VPYQQAVTIRATITPARRAALDEVLRRIASDPEHNATIPFGEFAGTHFARFVILPDAEVGDEIVPASLMYTACIDGAADDHLEQLIRLDGLDSVWSHCVGYPTGTATPAQRRSYLVKHQLPSITMYFNTLGRGVEQVRDEARLYSALQGWIDETRKSPDAAMWSATDWLQHARTWSRSNGRFEWALRPPSPPPIGARLARRAELVAVLLATLVLLPVLLVVVPIWLGVLRVIEARDARVPGGRLTQFRRGAVNGTEDQPVINWFSALGCVRPGLVRRVTLMALLHFANFASRHYFARRDLGSIPLLGLSGVDSIQFAQWVMLDNNRRVIFLSSYDGSLPNYMDDFINKLGWGMNMLFCHGDAYPATRWLALDGCHNEQVFKAFLQKHQVRTQVGFAANKWHTALNLAAHSTIRAGIAGDVRDASAWARAL
jgi:hypothetical protein